MIGPKDVLEINVWKNPDLSKSVVVRPDGVITLTLIGEVLVGGTTPNRVREEIQSRLSSYYKEIPEVTVTVSQINSYDIFVLGEVRNPGKYQVKSHTSVLQAIALGGGFTEWARKNKMIILRRGQDSQDFRISVRYNDILDSKAPDLLLQREDRLIVP